MKPIQNFILYFVYFKELFSRLENPKVGRWESGSISHNDADGMMQAQAQTGKEAKKQASGC
jgi:hypothetical protein